MYNHIITQAPNIVKCTICKTLPPTVCIKRTNYDIFAKLSVITES